jgi:TonB-dependent receptor
MAATAISALALAAPGFASAQTIPAAAPAPAEETIVVRGIRRSIKQALDIKKSAVGAVDSIASEDLGKLPDQNVAESLQRVAGVTIDRNRGEGQYVTVRGFGPKFNAVTVNGRTIATDNQGREFSFDVLPSELIVGADVYKSPQANINGASIGATIDVRTLRPLDQKAFVAAGSIESMNADLAGTNNPQASGIVSWHNSQRNFGAALAVSYKKEDTRDDEFTIGAGHVHHSSNDSYFTGRVDPSVGAFTNIDMPSNLSPFFYTRQKTTTGLNGSVQWKPNENLTLTLDGLYSKLKGYDLQTGLAYDFSGGTLVEQRLDANKEAIYQKYHDGFVDEIIEKDPRNVTTTAIGFNALWKKDQFELSFDASTSKAQTRGKEDSLFTTFRLKHVDLWYDRSSGSPIYNYGFTDLAGNQVATSPNNRLAHYYIWGGGNDKDDTTTEYKLDGKWFASDTVTFFAGLANETRTKVIVANSTPGSQQCLYCNSNEVLPSSLFSSTASNFMSDYNGNILHDWVQADPLAVVKAVAALAQSQGKAFAPGTFNAAGSSNIEEKVNIGYVMTELKNDVAGMPLAVNVGVRIEDTKYTSSGAAQTVLSAAPNGGGQNIITLSGIVPVSFSGHYTDILPSFNARLNISDDLIARFDASRVMTRPTLSDLSPAQSIQTNPGNETIKHGNPDLQPFRASQVEGGLEWYFDKYSILSATAFYKNIDSFVTLVTTPQKVDQVTFQVTVPSNGKGATVKGFELGYRQVYSDLPSPLDGLGAQASFTYAESNAKYTNTVANVSYGLEGLSRYSYSLVGFYEKYGIQARVAYTWRDKFLQVASGRNGEPEYFDAYGQLDASLSYDIGNHATVFIDGLNLNDEKEFIYSVTPNRTKEYRDAGKRITVGVRLRY